MKISTSNIVSKPNYLHATKHQIMGSSKFCAPNSNNISFKVTNSWGQNGNSTHTLSIKKLPRDNKWMELQGIKNWEGLLDPLDDRLRDEILRYGDFVEAAYRCFNFDTSSPGYATCCYPKDSMLSHTRGLNGHKVTKCLHATCGIDLPRWADRLPGWASARSSWIGYVAVCTDRAEIARLGRRDVVIAYRGTATCMEWAENLRVTLAGLPDDMAHDDKKSMVQSGLLSLYTSSDGTRPSLRDTVRDEVRKILSKYGNDGPLSITVTGHSLGAALATLTAHDINTTFKDVVGPKPLVTVVSFGGPRVGNKSFRRQLEKSGTKVLRIVNADDPVTKVPGFVVNEPVNDNGEMGMLTWIKKCVEETQWVYAEIGKELRLSSKDCADLSDRGVATCHDLKTYLHLVNNFASSNCPLRATAKRVLSRPDKQEDKQQVLCS
ncbi:Dolichyl-diphosphooligosaccharide-protein glycosyltransferase subunit dad1 [Castilleja foliolosa]|uniref:Dolichyl-diphosphooligosaccharide-protein glycosyltransferase subunit dad1 n=1 Tax=Castilleja foliolosa TaxID=1961234 RepID=A0ABD3B8J3_9LAMI